LAQQWREREVGMSFGVEDRERRKASMQKCNITYGFENLDYHTTQQHHGNFETQKPQHDNTAMAEGMRKSSIWWKDSDHLKATAPKDRYNSSMTTNFDEKKPEPNSMGMTIPEIKEFHRKTNLDIGHVNLGYNTTAGDTFQDFSQCKGLICEVDIPHLVLATPQCPQVAQNDYMSTAAHSYDGQQGEGGGPNTDNIKEMRRSHFEVGFDPDAEETTHRSTFHRHPFLQAKDNADKVAELRRTNWTLGYEPTDYRSTQARTFSEGDGSAAYPQGVNRLF